MPPRRVSFVTLSKRKQENPRKLMRYGGIDDLTKISKCPIQSPVPTPAPTQSNIQAMEELLQMAKITKAQQPKKWGQFVQEEKLRSYSRPTVTRSSQSTLQNMERLAKIRGGKKIHQIQKLRELAQLTKKPMKEKSPTYKRLKALDTPLAISKPKPKPESYSRPTATKITPSKTISEKMAKVRAAKKTTRVAKVKGAKKIKQIQTLRELAQLPKKSPTYKRLKALDTPLTIPKSKPESYSRPTATKIAPSKAMSEKMAKVRAARKINQMQRLRGLAKLAPKSQSTPKPKSKTKYKRLKNLDRPEKKKNLKI